MGREHVIFLRGTWTRRPAPPLQLLPPCCWTLPHAPTLYAPVTLLHPPILRTFCLLVTVIQFLCSSSSVLLLMLLSNIYTLIPSLRSSLYVSSLMLHPQCSDDYIMLLWPTSGTPIRTSKQVSKQTPLRNPSTFHHLSSYSFPFSISFFFFYLLRNVRVKEKRCII